MALSLVLNLDGLYTFDENVTSIDIDGLELLDQRANALFLEAQLTLAFQKARRMIELAPTSATGYLRLGSFYSQLGQQRTAIEIYRLGLQRVPRREPHRSQLEKNKKVASAQKRKGIDFFKILDDKLIFNILSQATLPVQAVCTTVSKHWHEKIISYAGLWRTLDFSGRIRPSKAHNLIPYIASHVEELGLFIKNYEDLDSCIHYFDYLRTGCFKSLESLTVCGVLASEFQCHNVIPALKQLQNTLRCLSVTIDGISDPRTVTTVAAILNSAPNLNDLTYCIRYPMSTSAGDLSKINKKHPLLALNLQVPSIDACDLSPLLHKCPLIRRLILKHAHLSALSVLFLCPNLEILGFGTQNVPELTTEQLKADPTGLRVLRTPLYNHRFEYAHFYPLLYENMNTLEDIQANWMLNCGYKSLKLLPLEHTDFKFTKLQNLNVRFDRSPHTFQRTFLPAMRDCTTLSDISVQNVRLTPFLDTLQTLPHLKNLLIDRGIATYRKACSLELERLFKSSATQSLERVQLQDTITVSDHMLANLATIPTLKEIELSMLRAVTTDGIIKFFKVLGNHPNLISLDLASMASVDDRSIRMLAKIRSLQSITLKRLLNVTGMAVQDMALDIVKHNVPLKKFKMGDCPKVSLGELLHIQKHILISTLCSVSK